MRLFTINGLLSFRFFDIQSFSVVDVEQLDQILHQMILSLRCWWTWRRAWWHEGRHRRRGGRSPAGWWWWWGPRGGSERAQRALRSKSPWRPTLRLTHRWWGGVWICLGHLCSSTQCWESIPCAEVPRPHHVDAIAQRGATLQAQWSLCLHALPDVVLWAAL